MQQLLNKCIFCTVMLSFVRWPAHEAVSLMAEDLQQQERLWSRTCWVAIVPPGGFLSHSSPTPLYFIADFRLKQIILFLLYFECKMHISTPPLFFFIVFKKLQSPPYLHLQDAFFLNFSCDYFTTATVIETQTGNFNIVFSSHSFLARFWRKMHKAFYSSDLLPEQFLLQHPEQSDCWKLIIWWKWFNEYVSINVITCTRFLWFYDSPRTHRSPWPACTKPSQSLSPQRDDSWKVTVKGLWGASCIHSNNGVWWVEAVMPFSHVFHSIVCELQSLIKWLFCWLKKNPFFWKWNKQDN